MVKLKLYLINALFSGLIGVLVNILMMFIVGWRYFSVYGLLFSMAVGVIIGTVSMFFFFHIFLKLKKRPVFAFLFNFMVVAVLNIAGALIFGGLHSQLVLMLWLLALVVSEALSFLLIWAWCRRIAFYKEKLEQKKARGRFSCLD